VFALALASAVLHAEVPQPMSRVSEMSKFTANFISIAFPDGCHAYGTSDAVHGRFQTTAILT
jgi:hypothetical protein